MSRGWGGDTVAPSRCQPGASTSGVTRERWQWGKGAVGAAWAPQFPPHTLTETPERGSSRPPEGSDRAALELGQGLVVSHLAPAFLPPSSSSALQTLSFSCSLQSFSSSSLQPLPADSATPPSLPLSLLLLLLTSPATIPPPPPPPRRSIFPVFLFIPPLSIPPSLPSSSSLSSLPHCLIPLPCTAPCSSSLQSPSLLFSSSSFQTSSLPPPVPPSFVSPFPPSLQPPSLLLLLVPPDFIPRSCPPGRAHPARGRRGWAGGTG